MNTTKLTRAQIDWARQHDWFVHENRNGTIVVEDRYNDGTNTVLTWIGTFRQLREWGGY